MSEVRSRVLNWRRTTVGMGVEVALGDADRSALIARWILKSSESEELRMDRAERMVRAAIDKHPPFQDDAASFRVYVKGSYANETNVRQDSDVDVVVENQRLFYWEYLNEEIASKATPDPNPSPYTGVWTPAKWRSEVESALKNHFGGSDVDTSGSVAITISEVPGSRPSADVVPAFQYHRYDRPDRAASATQHGSKVFKKAGGTIINYPFQQLQNGRSKDRRSSCKYKEFARALKNGENALVKAGLLEEKPSYFMECLAYNVPDGDLTRGGYSRSAWFRHALATLHNALLPSGFDNGQWVEPNELKYLFHSTQKWSVDDARELTRNLWDYLEYE